MAAALQSECSPAVHCIDTEHRTVLGGRWVGEWAIECVEEEEMEQEGSRKEESFKIKTETCKNICIYTYI